MSWGLVRPCHLQEGSDPGSYAREGGELCPPILCRWGSNVLQDVVVKDLRFEDKDKNFKLVLEDPREGLSPRTPPLGYNVNLTYTVAVTEFMDFT